MSKKQIIGLFGIYGLYNYGCEAIVRGTYELIKQAWPDCDIILYTFFATDDKEIIGDLEIKIKKAPVKNNQIIRRIINKVLRIFSIRTQLSIWDAKSVADECDVIFSVGGDIYTIPKHLLDSNKEPKHNLIVEFGKGVLKRKPLIIWGASIGPFGNNKKVNRYYFDHLKEVTQIFCREEKTLNYLVGNGITNNIQLYSDPAFYIKSTHSKELYLKGKKIRIALNLSPLSIREQIGENYDSFKDEIIITIIELLSIPNTEIVLVPHVISPLSEKDNDLAYLGEIYKKIPNEYKNSVILLGNMKGFLGTKEFLKTCDVAIAARMHCAVNAICESIPTIFLTYSQKGLGMSHFIYGNYKWAIPILDIKKELKNKTLEMLREKENISKIIKKKIEEILSEESKIVNSLKKITKS
ncbi:MAG: polysaccharide pyruvyl transferase family protein [Clostridia bacterium]|nr:polysaccharide pyruvyl transferase family protein [Clostridia bacterium]